MTHILLVFAGFHPKTNQKGKTSLKGKISQGIHRRYYTVARYEYELWRDMTLCSSGKNNIVLATRT